MPAAHLGLNQEADWKAKAGSVLPASNPSTIAARTGNTICHLHPSTI